MTLNEYQEMAMTTCMDSSRNTLYMLFGLCEETGELQGKFSKAIRKGLLQATGFNQIIPTAENVGRLDSLREDIKREIGDVMWMSAGLCHVMGWSLEDVCQTNLDKLASRQQRNVIDGSGDNR